MLLKPFACYATGVLTTALAVSMGCGRWGVICYALGLMSSLVLCYALFRRPAAARLAIKLLNRVVGDTPATPKRPSAPKREKWVPPCQRNQPQEFVTMGTHKIAVDPEWQNARKLSKRKQWQYACEELAKLPMRKQEIQAKPGTPAYDFLNDPELFGV